MKNASLNAIHDLASVCHQKGILKAILCPGSRNAPLITAFASHPGITSYSCVDERSGAYIAMGMAQGSGHPVAFVCTSGTAALNAGPAVAEAFYQHIPLVVLTADRPPEWIDQRDGQTIRQNGLYGAHVKSSSLFPLAETHPDAAWHAIRLLNDAINLSMQAPSGPVHINVPLREPLYYTPGVRPVVGTNLKLIEPIFGSLSLAPDQRAKLEDEFASCSKILILGGQGPRDAQLIRALSLLASRLPIPIVGDVVSNLHGVLNGFSIPDYAAAHLKAADAPDLLITFGHSILSKRLKMFFRDYQPKAHWHVSVSASPDTFQSLTRHIEESPTSFITNLAAFRSRKKELAKYGKRLKQISRAAKDKFGCAVERCPGFSEFRAIGRVLQALPARSALHLGNSLSVRLADYCGITSPGIEVFANRGTSGIDGSLSTAVGHALSDPARPHVLILGDLAFFYDINGLWHNHLPRNLRIVMLNNFGGGFFSLIKGPGDRPSLLPFFKTPHAREGKLVARDFGLAYQRVADLDSLRHKLAAFFNPSTKAKLLEMVFEKDIDPSLVDI